LLPLLLPLHSRPPRATLFPYTTLFRSLADLDARQVRLAAQAFLDEVAHRMGEHLRLADRAALEQRLDRAVVARPAQDLVPAQQVDRKSTRLNSSHVKISYAVFCLKKKK